jgi:hypothetical protein
MNKIVRNNCIICKGSLIDVKTYANFPIYMGTTADPRDTDLFLDMTFSKCEQCSTVQIRNLVPLEQLYFKGHNTSIGQVWNEHHLQFSEFINKSIKGKVVEVGGAHLILAKQLEKNTDIESITVYDTNLSCYNNSETDKIFLREQFFSKDSVTFKPDAIIHSHVVEHLYNPMEEIRQLSELLEDGKHMFISAPIIDVMMEDKFTNAMNFEHTYGLTKSLLYKILSHSSLEITRTQDYNKHCVFIEATKNSSMDTNVHLEHDSLFLSNFVDYYDNEVNRIHELLSQDDREKFIFGAHIFTQSLINFGLSEKHFSFILDNDTAKQGERLYGTGLSVRSPRILKGLDSPLVVLKAGQYTQEIKNDILKNINSSTRFIL